MSLITGVPLRKRVFQSGSVTFVGYGLGQALRFGGNLVLTRLLFPEAFGMMAILQIVIYALHMLTDVGIETSIVQKDRGSHPDFLNTAWTIQTLRGLLIWIGLCFLALPIAHFYHEPKLSGMLVVVGLSSVISGFNSTKLYTAQRNLEAGRITLIELGSSAAGLFCTIILAWLMASVWALVLGNLLTSMMKMLSSHVFLHGVSNRFRWERDSLNQLRGFGRWIMTSSILTFLSVEGGRLLISALLDVRQLALFTLANTMSLMFWQAIFQLSTKVFFPAYSEVYRTNPRRLESVLFKSRLILMAPSFAIAVIFIFFGTQLMQLLYDQRYHGSGEMLVVLAAGTLVNFIWGSYSSAIWAMGKVATMTGLTTIQIACQFSAMYFGYHFWGEAGIIFGIALAYWLIYPAYAYVAHRNGIWHYKLDAVFLMVAVMVVAVAWPRFLLGNIS